MIRQSFDTPFRTEKTVGQTKVPETYVRSFEYIKENSAPLLSCEGEEAENGALQLYSWSSRVLPSEKFLLNPTTSHQNRTQHLKSLHSPPHQSHVSMRRQREKKIHRNGGRSQTRRKARNSMWECGCEFGNRVEKRHDRIAPSATLKVCSSENNEKRMGVEQNRSR
jgi:hypothetical protein